MTHPITHGLSSGLDRASIMDSLVRLKLSPVEVIEAQPVSFAPLQVFLEIWKADLRNGSPLIAKAPLELHGLQLKTHATRTEALLSEKLGSVFTGLCDSIEEANSSLDQYVERVLRGDAMVVAHTASEADVPLEAMAFFTTYVCRLVRQAVAQACELQFGTADWLFGYCPVCGMWPRMAHIDASTGVRRLWCVGCGSLWMFPRLVCPFCGERDQKLLGYLFYDEDTSSRVYTCERCRRYLKTRTSAITGAQPELSFDVEYLSSLPLDMLAGAEGYIQDFAGFVAFDFQDNAAARSYRQAVLDIR